jgi:putative transposase
MADENNTGSTTDVAVADAPAKAVEPKKQRAPRRPKPATDMMGGLTVAKLPRGSRKRSEQVAEKTLTPVETPVTSKREAKGVVKEDGRKTRHKPVEQPVAAPLRQSMKWRISSNSKKRTSDFAKPCRRNCVRKTPTCANGSGLIDHGRQRTGDRP